MADVSPAHRRVHVAHPFCIFCSLQVSVRLAVEQFGPCGDVFLLWAASSMLRLQKKDEHTSQKNRCEMSAAWKNAWNHERVEGFGNAADSTLDFLGSVALTAVAGRNCDSWGHGNVGSLDSRSVNFWPAYPVPSSCGIRLRRGMASAFSSAWRFISTSSTWSRGNAKSGSSIWRHLHGTVDHVGLALNIHAAWWFWLQISTVDLNALRPTFYLIWRCWSCFGKWKRRQGANWAQWIGGKATRRHKEIASMDIVLQETTLVFADQAKPRTNHSPVPLQESLVASLLVGLIPLNFGKTHVCQSCDSGRSNCRMCLHCESWCRNVDGPRARAICWRKRFLVLPSLVSDKWGSCLYSLWNKQSHIGRAAHSTRGGLRLSNWQVFQSKACV